tara:strand:+ start:326 stop:661 length:336 start_codon:yes stop_codon:yes gene_type:complete
MNYEKHWQTDKSMNKWAKVMRKKLEGRWLDSFNQQFATMSKANQYTKATYVMYWEIQTDDELSKYAIYTTQAILMTMTDKFLTLNKVQEANAVHMMNVNFARLIGGLDEEE